jgi:hypothetical protein
MNKPGKKEIRMVLEDAMMMAVLKLNLKPSKKTIRIISKAAKEGARHLKDDLMVLLKKDKAKTEKEKKATKKKAKAAPGNN